MLVFDTVSKSFRKRVVLTNCSFQLPANKLLEQPMATAKTNPRPTRHGKFTATDAKAKWTCGVGR